MHAHLAVILQKVNNLSVNLKFGAGKYQTYTKQQLNSGDVQRLKLPVTHHITCSTVYRYVKAFLTHNVIFLCLFQLGT